MHSLDKVSMPARLGRAFHLRTATRFVILMILPAYLQVYLMKTAQIILYSNRTRSRSGEIVADTKLVLHFICTRQVPTFSHGSLWNKNICTVSSEMKCKYASKSKGTNRVACIKKY